MSTGRVLRKSFWLPVALAVTGAIALGHFGLNPPVQASPPVDQNVRALSGAPASFADVVEAVQPAVVNISVAGTVLPGRRGQELPGLPFEDFEDFLRRFFERQSYPGGDSTPSFQGMGSGFIVDPHGYVVTNDHVVTRASEIVVTLHDGKRLPATLVGTDPKTDLALLKVEPDAELPYARFGNSDRTRVGDWVVAIGNPFGLGGSATAGIVSARGRDIQSGPFDDFLQIDAPINQGNSGGPLFDLEGRVIGINTAIYSPNGGNVGIGFAIPSKLAEHVIAELRESGRVERGWLGVSIQPVDSEIAASLGLGSERGALVASVVAGSPAEAAGIQPGDVIVSIAGQEVDRVKDLSRRVAEISPDETIQLEVLRRGERKTLEARVGTSPTDVASAPPSTRESAPALGLSLGELTPPLRARLGVASDVKGAVVAGVVPGSPSHRKGIREGDVVVMVGQTPVENVAEASSEIERQKSSGRESVLLRVVRAGEALFIAVPLG